jgi:hypothetical protein
MKKFSLTDRGSNMLEVIDSKSLEGFYLQSYDELDGSPHVLGDRSPVGFHEDGQSVPIGRLQDRLHQSSNRVVVLDAPASVDGQALVAAGGVPAA